jgi:hypothetical protein
VSRLKGASDEAAPGGSARHYAIGAPKRDPRGVTRWDILLWDIELQQTKLLGVVDAINPHRAVEKASRLFRIKNAEQRDRLIAVRRGA